MIRRFGYPVDTSSAAASGVRRCAVMHFYRFHDALGADMISFGSKS